MSRNGNAPLPPSSAAFEREIEALRQRIDTIDTQLLGLLNARATVVADIYALKRRHGVTRLDRARSDAILDRLAAASAGPAVAGRRAALSSTHCSTSSSSATHPRKSPPPLASLPDTELRRGPMARDILFQENSATRDFTFDTKVAQVFDDMVGRSVPFYGEIQRMLSELALQFTPDQDGRISRSRLLDRHDARPDSLEPPLSGDCAWLWSGQRSGDARAGARETRAARGRQAGNAADSGSRRRDRTAQR